MIRNRVKRFRRRKYRPPLLSMHGRNGLLVNPPSSCRMQFSTYAYQRVAFGKTDKIDMQKCSPVIIKWDQYPMNNLLKNMSLQYERFIFNKVVMYLSEFKITRYNVSDVATGEDKDKTDIQFIPIPVSSQDVPNKLIVWRAPISSTETAPSLDPANTSFRAVKIVRRGTKFKLPYYCKCKAAGQTVNFKDDATLSDMWSRMTEHAPEPTWYVGPVSDTTDKNQQLYISVECKLETKYYVTYSCRKYKHSLL